MNTEEDIPEKSQIYREHMERVSVRIAAEEEAFKFSRTIKPADTKNYKNRRYFFSVEQELSDKTKLTIIRGCQFLIGLMGLVGTGMIFLSIYDWMSYHSSIEMSLMWLVGCTLTTVSIVATVGLQYKHDKISDRIRTEST
jgi:hypothetical protein